MEHKILVSFFPNGILNTTYQSHITIEELYLKITTDQKLKHQINNARSVLKKHGKGKIYQNVKCKLSYFVPSGIWSDRTREGKLLEHSGLVQIDIDNITTKAELERVRSALKSDKHTLLMFNSPSLGVKALFQLPLPHLKKNINVVYGYFKDKYDIKLDTMVLHSPKHACFLSYDEQAYFNPDYQTFTILAEEERPINNIYNSIINTVVPTNSGLPKHKRAFIDRVLSNGASRIANAFPTEGCNQLNSCAYYATKFHHEGLLKSDAMAAFKDAFLSRKHSKHTEKEFIIVFELGWNAGLDNPNNRQDIVDRPPERQ